MEFGKISEIDRVDWSVPADDPLNEAFLRSISSSSERTEFHLGTPAWGHKEWIGKIYPPGAKPKDFLFHYSRNFSSIEFNSAHYRIPNEDQIRKWVDQVPPGFLFLPKINQAISHSPNGLLDSWALDQWIKSLEFYGSHRGPSFLQLPPSFDYERKAELFHLLQRRPDEFELALEFRHASWFENGHVLPALAKYLQSRRIGLVITDVAGRRDVLHTSITAPFVILRFIANDLHPSDFRRSRAWAERFRAWQEQGLRRLFFIVHEPDDRLGPEMADRVIYDLNEVCGADLPRIQWATLFNQGTFDEGFANL